MRSSNSFHSAESPQKTIAPHLAFNPRGSLEHKRFVYLVHGACSLSCLASLQPDPSCSIITLPADIRHPRYCKENATVEACSVLSDCRKAGVQTKDGVRTLGPVWMPIRRAGQTTALVSAVAQSQLWRSSTSPSLASKRQNPSPGKDRVAHNEGVALAARRRWLPTASAATKERRPRRTSQTTVGREAVSNLLSPAGPTQPPSYLLYSPQ